MTGQNTVFEINVVDKGLDITYVNVLASDGLLSQLRIKSPQAALASNGVIADVASGDMTTTLYFVVSSA